MARPSPPIAGWVSLCLSIIGWAVLLIALIVYDPPLLAKKVPDTTHFMVLPLIFVSGVMIGAIISGFIGRKKWPGAVGLAFGIMFFILAFQVFLVIVGP